MGGDAGDAGWRTCLGLAEAQKSYQALVGVVQLLQDLVHYGVGQVGDNRELHFTVGTGGWLSSSFPAPEPLPQPSPDA